MTRRQTITSILKSPNHGQPAGSRSEWSMNRRQFIATATSVVALSLFDRGMAAQVAQGVDDVSIVPYSGPAGGWGALRSVATHLVREEVPLSGSRLLLAQNKPDGFQCVSCAWAKPADHSPFEFCENGAKATLWELTDHRIGEEFFAKVYMQGSRGVAGS